ncbi:PAS domain-containing protein [bacterium]|nr:PAS domain-containing protein [bacterium]
MKWADEIPISITVCDADGIILEMNQRAIETYASQGGARLIGTDVLDCHPEPSRTQLEGMLETHSKNVYTIEKRGVKKLIYQSPWYENGEYKGFVELSMEIPFELPHFVRKG